MALILFTELMLVFRWIEPGLIPVKMYTTGFLTHIKELIECEPGSFPFACLFFVLYSRSSFFSSGMTQVWEYRVHYTGTR